MGCMIIVLTIFCLFYLLGSWAASTWEFATWLPANLFFQMTAILRKAGISPILSTNAALNVSYFRGKEGFVFAKQDHSYLWAPKLPVSFGSTNRPWLNGSAKTLANAKGEWKSLRSDDVGRKLAKYFWPSCLEFWQRQKWASENSVPIKMPPIRKH
jgi:hypothetical protein